MDDVANRRSAQERISGQLDEQIDSLFGMILLYRLEIQYRDNDSIKNHAYKKLTISTFSAVLLEMLTSLGWTLVTDGSA